VRTNAASWTHALRRLRTSVTRSPKQVCLKFSCTRRRSIILQRSKLHPCRDWAQAAAHAKSGCDRCSNCTRLRRCESHSAAHPSAAACSAEQQPRQLRAARAAGGALGAPAKLWVRVSWRQGPKLDGPCRLACSALELRPSRPAARAAGPGATHQCAWKQDSRQKKARSHPAQQAAQSLSVPTAPRLAWRPRCARRRRGSDAQSFAALVARSR